MKYLPVCEPLLDGNEKKYLAECIDTGWISSEGPFVKRLESGFAERVGRRHAVAVSNGSNALEVALACLDLPRGSEVIVPDFTIISCVHAIVRNGLVPVFVDADPVTWNMDVSDLHARLSERTRAILMVHIYGLPSAVDEILQFAREHDLKVIEDAAEAHALYYRGRPCGSFGDLSVFSFYPNKLVTTGEGGLILSDDETLANTCRSLCNLSFIPEQRFLHHRMGWNFRMSNLQAAVGVAQLEQLDRNARRKREIGQQYEALLCDLPCLQRPAPRTDGAENGYWVFGVVLDDAIDFDARHLATLLADRGIGTRPFFWPMHEQPVLREAGYCSDEHYPVSSRIARRGLYLPTGLTLTAADLERVSDSLHEILA